MAVGGIEPPPGGDLVHEEEAVAAFAIRRRGRCLEPAAAVAHLHAQELGGERELVLLHLAVASDRVRVEVTDGGSGFEPGPPMPYGEGGYGLFLVSEVSSRWGASRADSNCTWFEIEL